MIILMKKKKKKEENSTEHNLIGHIFQIIHTEY